MDNPLARLTKNKERTQIIKFSNEKGDITTDKTRLKEIEGNCTNNSIPTN